MSEETDVKEYLARVVNLIQMQAFSDNMRITRHAYEEMAEEPISLNDLLAAVSTAAVLENYPDHRRGPCCLLYGRTDTNQDLHIVCTTASPILIIITVYVPQPPKWVSATQRRDSS
ncbi:MAG: DUF4258 domain-containing protein [Armatimonadetes bacterium]|nr:DUF4258 domain-containing protein [Armatimonadota bacterium]